MIKLRRIMWAGHVAHVGDEITAYGVFVGKCEGKGSLGSPRSWEDNIKMGLRIREC
jgi:hypothetical protein